jgi:hypothetical protein
MNCWVLLNDKHICNFLFRNLLKIVVLVAFAACQRTNKVVDNRFPVGSEVIEPSFSELIETSKDSIVEIIFPDLNKDGTKIIDTDRLIDSVWYVPLETSDQSIISGISNLIIHEQYVYILDFNQKSVLLFGVDGKFIKRIGSAGRGPQEYILPKSISINEYTNEFLIHDDKRQNVMVYDLEGNFLRDQKIGFRMNDFMALEDGGYMINNHLVDNRHLPEIAKKQVFKVNKDWKIVSAGLNGEVNDCSEFGDLRPGFYKTNSQILYNPSYSSIVYQYNEGVFKPKYNLNLGTMSFPDNFLCGLSLDQYKKLYDNTNAPFGQFEKAIIETDEWLIAPPIYKRMLFYTFYSKKTKELFFNLFYESSSKSEQFISMTPIIGVVKNDVFYGFKNSSVLYNEIIDQQKTKKLELNKELKDLDVGDNPVLIFYKLKDQQKMS